MVMEGERTASRVTDAADHLREAPSCLEVEPPPTRGKEARILLEKPP